MNARLMRRPARAAAALGALVAAGAVTLVATMGTANAAGAGRCTDNVNVRSEPDISSEIVAVCERGQSVQIGQTRDGFVQLTDLKGWAAQEFVSVDGHVGAAPATPRTTSAKPTSENTTGRGHGSATDTTRQRSVFDGPAFDNRGDDRSADAEPTTTDAVPAADDAGSADDADMSTTGGTNTGRTNTDGTNTDGTAQPAQASKPAPAAGPLGGLLG
jgi:uncharacterized protein YraI